MELILLFAIVGGWIAGTIQLFQKGYPLLGWLSLGGFIFFPLGFVGYVGLFIQDQREEA